MEETSTLAPGDDHKYRELARAHDVLTSKIAKWISLHQEPGGSLEAIGQLLDARTAIYTVDAAKRTNVLRFRRDELGGDLLKPSEVPGWLRRHEQDQVANDPSSLGYTELRSEPSDPIDGENAWPAFVKHPLLIEVSATRNRAEAQMLVSRGIGPATAKVLVGGVLSKLLSVAKEIGFRYGWPKDQTAGWIPTATPPTPA